MKKALTLVEVILALGIMAVGIVLGMELLGKLTAANAQISSAERLQQRIWDTRALIADKPFASVHDIFEESEVWQISPLALARLNPDITANTSFGIPLSVELLDSNNATVFTFAAIKTVDSSHE